MLDEEGRYQLLAGLLSRDFRAVGFLLLVVDGIRQDLLLALKKLFMCFLITFLMRG